MSIDIRYNFVHYNVGNSDNSSLEDNAFSDAEVILRSCIEIRCIVSNIEVKGQKVVEVIRRLIE